MKTVVRGILALAAALFAACASPTLAWAQATPPVSKLRVEAAAQHALDSLANDARTTRIENAACLTGYTVKGDSLIVSAFGPADYAKADSVSIWAHVNSLVPGDPQRVPLCPLGTPTLHSHVAYDGLPEPSDTDLHSSEAVGMWALLLSVGTTGWRIIVY